MTLSVTKLTLTLLSCLGLYVKTNGVIKEVDLETEIHTNKVKMMISSLGANKENERALQRVTGKLEPKFEPGVYIYG